MLNFDPYYQYQRLYISSLDLSFKNIRGIIVMLMLVRDG